MFTCAKPVWAEGRERDVNEFLRFSWSLPEQAARVRLTASCAYQLYLNGTFMHYGPARAGDGYFRVDEWPLKSSGELKVLVAGYYVATFQYSFYPSFLCMEVLDGEGRVLLATGRDPVDCREEKKHERWVDRYSRQRAFLEVWDFRSDLGEALHCKVQPEPKYLDRNVPAFSNTLYVALKELGDRDVFSVPFPEHLLHADGSTCADCSILWMNEQYSTGRLPKLNTFLFREVMSLGFGDMHPVESKALTAGQSRTYDFGINRAGLITLEAEVKEESTVYLIFDELTVDGDVVAKRSNCLDAVKYIFPAGTHHTVTMEPYTFRYLKIAVTRGHLDTVTPGMIEQAGVRIAPVHFEDPVLQRIFDAAVNTFRQNATDLFMDCPSRERAGWLCDSFFTARTEYALTGKSIVEHNFLENYARHGDFIMPTAAPDGMVPMLYPGATRQISAQEWIPNWALWLILEIEEYFFDRHGDPVLVENLRGTVYGILNALRPNENEYGMLEDLTGWVFVEWSRANDRDVVCGVNFPTNMLYSRACEAAGHLYGDKPLIEKAQRLRETVRQWSRNGTFFADNAIRENGKLVRTENVTEVCQYYAFFFGIADPQRDPELWDILLKVFGPERKQKGILPEVAYANAFIGNYLRLEVLMREGKTHEVLENIRGYFAGMAERTGSLWEYDDTRASCCHGFASHVAVWLLKLR